MVEETKAVTTKVEVKPVTVKQDTSVILIVIYLMFQANMLTRHNVGHMLQIIEKPFPENLAEWLLKESKR